MKLKLLSITAFVLALSACGTLTSIDDYGKPVGELVWPNVDKVSLDNGKGVAGDLNRIKLIHSGATRDDVRHLLGHPHFQEGFGSREWDYLFHFANQRGGVITCQYKILFDTNKLARNSYWKTVEPSNAHCPPSLAANAVPSVVPSSQQAVSNSAPTKPAIHREIYVIQSDTLFNFNRSGLHNLLPGGVNQLNRLAQKVLTEDNVRHIRIVGHADRIGSERYNLKLSKNRAETVKQYFVQQGISEKIIETSGVGAAQPVNHCNGKKVTPELKACLQPNRRVTVEIIH